MSQETFVARPDTFRRAVAGDAAAFQALQERAYAWNRSMLGLEPLPLQTSAAEVLASYETWLLEEDGVLAGAVVLDRHHPDHVLIWSVSVDPGRQNAGLGRRLLAGAEARARELGVPAIRLYAAEKLTKNVDWYGRRGYQIERVEELPDRRAVHMVKQLQ